MFIEAMVDAAEYLDLPRENAYILAAQAVKGAAEMVLKSGKHPEELKDMVCTPAGTAIEGVKYLEGQGIRSIIMKAVIVSAEKAKMLSDKYK
jgi:pyrroline-5-carboxylate reductase